MVNYQSQFLKLVLANLKAQELQNGTIKVIIKSFKLNRKLLEALGIEIMPYQHKTRPRGNKMPKDSQEPGWFKSFRQEFNGFRKEFSGLREEFDGLREEFNGLRDEFTSLHKQFDGFREEFDSFREENNQRWIENDKRWEEQMKFNQKVDKNFELLFSLPTIQKEVKEKQSQKE